MWKFNKQPKSVRKFTCAVWRMCEKFTKTIENEAISVLCCTVFRHSMKIFPERLFSQNIYQVLILESCNLDKSWEIQKCTMKEWKKLERNSYFCNESNMQIVLHKNINGQCSKLHRATLNLTFWKWKTGRSLRNEEEPLWKIRNRMTEECLRSLGTLGFSRTLREHLGI